MALADILGDIEAVANTATTNYLKIQEAIRQGRDPREALDFTDEQLRQAELDRQKSRVTLAVIVGVVLVVAVLAYRRR